MGLLVLVRSGFRAIVHVTDVVKLEFLSIFLTVGICQVTAHVQCAVKLHVALRQVLALRGDAVHVVVAHCQCVACRLAVCTRVGSGCACQTVQCIVGVAVAHLRLPCRSVAEPLRLPRSARCSLRHTCRRCP